MHLVLSTLRKCVVFVFFLYFSEIMVSACNYYWAFILIYLDEEITAPQGSCFHLTNTSSSLRTQCRSTRLYDQQQRTIWLRDTKLIVGNSLFVDFDSDQFSVKYLFYFVLCSELIPELIPELLLLWCKQGHTGLLQCSANTARNSTIFVYHGQPSKRAKDHDLYITRN